MSRSFVHQSMARLWLTRRAGRVQSRAANSAGSLWDYSVTFGWKDSMRSMPLMAVSTIVLATAWACGGDGGNVEPNSPPVAVFTAPVNCTAAVACTFSDASTDDHGVTSLEWDFADATEKVTVSGSSTTHTYAEANDYTVTLKVTDAAGETNSVSHT